MTRLAFAVLFLIAGLIPSAADDAGDIRSVLERWRDDFNARRSDVICDLFAREVIADVRGVPERTYDDVCGVLQKSLADEAKRFSYSLDIKDILVEGNLAAVRLVWTLKIAPPVDVTSVEHGLDILRRQPDGTWKIVRFQTYDSP
jgi:steroid delta-isomerase